MIKVGGHPGIPFQVKLTETEIHGDVHETSKLWLKQSRITAVVDLDQPDGQLAGVAAPAVVNQGVLDGWAG